MEWLRWFFGLQPKRNHLQELGDLTRTTMDDIGKYYSK